MDTRKSEFAAAADVGAEILNDVTALRADPLFAEVARRRKLLIALMYMRGKPRTMRKVPFARGVDRDVTAALLSPVAVARRTGLTRSQVILDPSFGKSWAQNFELLARLPELSRLGDPFLAGPLRKKPILPPLGGASKEARDWGTAATVAAAILGGVHIVRVHDVAEAMQVVRVTDAIANPALRPISPPSQ